MSPTQRTLKALRAKGLICGIVERRIPHTQITRDLFGIIDIIALDFSRGVVGVQSTGQAFSEHHNKLMYERRQECQAWLLTPGCHLELWGWRKLKAGWQPRVRVYTLADFADPFDGV